MHTTKALKAALELSSTGNVSWKLMSSQVKGSILVLREQRRFNESKYSKYRGDEKAKAKRSSSTNFSKPRQQGRSSLKPKFVRSLISLNGDVQTAAAAATIADGTRVGKPERLLDSQQRVARWRVLSRRTISEIEFREKLDKTTESLEQCHLHDPSDLDDYDDDMDFEMTGPRPALSNALTEFMPKHMSDRQDTVTANPSISPLRLFMYGAKLSEMQLSRAENEQKDDDMLDAVDTAPVSHSPTQPAVSSIPAATPLRNSSPMLGSNAPAKAAQSNPGPAMPSKAFAAAPFTLAGPSGSNTAMPAPQPSQAPSRSPGASAPPSFNTNPLSGSNPAMQAPPHTLSIAKPANVPGDLSSGITPPDSSKTPSRIPAINQGLAASKWSEATPLQKKSPAEMQQHDQHQKTKPITPPSNAPGPSYPTPAPSPSHTVASNMTTAPAAASAPSTAQGTLPGTGGLLTPGPSPPQKIGSNTSATPAAAPVRSPAQGTLHGTGKSPMFAFGAAKQFSSSALNNKTGSSSTSRIKSEAAADLGPDYTTMLSAGLAVIMDEDLALEEDQAISIIKGWVKESRKAVEPWERQVPVAESTTKWKNILYNKTNLCKAKRIQEGAQHILKFLEEVGVAHDDIYNRIVSQQNTDLVNKISTGLEEMLWTGAKEEKAEGKGGCHFEDALAGVKALKDYNPVTAYQKESWDVSRRRDGRPNTKER